MTARKTRRAAGATQSQSGLAGGSARRAGAAAGHQVDAGGDPLRPRVEADPPVPRDAVRHVVGEQRGGRADWRPRDGPRRRAAAPAPCSLHMNSPPVGPARGERDRASPGARPCRRASAASPSPAGAPRPARAARSARPATPDRSGRRRGSPRVGTDDDAGGLEPDVDPVRAEVALLGRVILGVDEDRVVGAGRDAGLAADADRLVEVDDAVRPPVHRRGRAGRRRTARRRTGCSASPGRRAAPAGRRRRRRTSRRCG